MGKSKSNMQFIIVNYDFETLISSISGLPEVIRDIKNSIEDFSSKHPHLKILRTEKGFALSPKAYMAIQHIIYEKIR